MKIVYTNTQENLYKIREVSKTFTDFEEFGAIDFESRLLNSKNVEVPRSPHLKFC